MLLQIHRGGRGLTAMDPESQEECDSREEEGPVPPG